MAALSSFFFHLYLPAPFHTFSPFTLGVWRWGERKWAVSFLIWVSLRLAFSFLHQSPLTIWRYFSHPLIFLFSRRSIVPLIVPIVTNFLISLSWPSPLLFSWLSPVQLLVTLWTAAHQASLSFTISELLTLMSIESTMLSNYLFPCHPFSFCLWSFPALGSSPMSWLFISGGQNTGASVLPMNIQDWFSLELTSLISL